MARLDFKVSRGYRELQVPLVLTAQCLGLRAPQGFKAHVEYRA
mgnify:CR=1 FL=1